MLHAVLIHYLGFMNSEAVAAVCPIIFNEALIVKDLQGKTSLLNVSPR